MLFKVGGVFPHWTGFWSLNDQRVKPCGVCVLPQDQALLGLHRDIKWKRVAHFGS